MNKKLIFFVAGLGRFGESVATTLENMGYEVMAMDLDEDVVQNLSSTLGYVVCADASEEKNLQAIGAGNADVALRYVGDDPERYPNIFRNARFDADETDQARLIQALKTR